MKHGRVQVLAVPLAAIVLAVIAAAGATLFMSTRSAHAEISGPCTATIAGVSVEGLDSRSTGDAIDVDIDDVIIASMASSQGFQSHKIDLHFLGDVFPARTVSQEEDNGETTFQENVDVSDYAWAGVGLYRVTGEATLTDGTRCTGAALVNVTGRNPLTTVAGGIAAGAAVAGTLGGLATGTVAATRNPGPLNPYDRIWRGLDEVAEARGDEEARRQAELEEIRRRDEERQREAARGLWTSITNLLGFRTISAAGQVLGCAAFAALAIVMMPLVAITGGGVGGESGGSGEPAEQASSEGQGPRRLPRAPWLPRITLLGIVSGLLAGAGGLVLLQQFAVAYPTVRLAVILLVVGAVVYGLVLPTLGYTIGWLRINGRLARLERSIGWR